MKVNTNFREIDLDKCQRIERKARVRCRGGGKRDQVAGPKKGGWRGCHQIMEVHKSGLHGCGAPFD